jgi:hypothetical protein
MAASLEGLISMELFIYLVGWLVKTINRSYVSSEVTTSLNRLEIFPHCSISRWKAVVYTESVNKVHKIE